MTRTAKISIVLGVVALAVSGCNTTMPADYTATLSDQDPKWLTPECIESREAALNYKAPDMNWAAGALIGPYGLAIVAAGKEHQAKQRIALARDMHLRCSSLPLPKELEITAPPATKGNSK